ncbi:MAG: glycosyltransferase family 2 protein [Candidatus Micrarchaeota archaeon]|nr:glycosyltransferase family 2 protein [Candidatus Micrarchaeota archaeon]
MKVSVVIPAYNAGAYIEESVRSCLMQDCGPEVLVVDDGSTDDCAVKARALGARVIQLPRNYGAATALNVGCWFANGEYIAWLSADDAFLSADKLSRQARGMEIEGTDFSYYSSFTYGRTKESAKERTPGLDFLMKHGYPFWPVMTGVFNPINGSSLMFKKDSFLKFGRFNQSLGNVDADGELILRWLRSGAKLLRIEGVGVFYRTHDGQISADKLKMLKGMVRSRLMVLLS